MRKKGNAERKVLADAPYWRRAFFYKLGTIDADAFKTKVQVGARPMSVWIISQTFKGFFNGNKSGMSKANAVAGLVALVEEAARTQDATKLRLLAKAIETHKLSNQQDPLRQILLNLSPIKKNDPDVQWLNRNLRAKQDDETSLPTAEQVEDFIRKLYPPGKAPTQKNIRKTAREEFGFELRRGKPGAPRGVPRKAMHRARR